MKVEMKGTPFVVSSCKVKLHSTTYSTKTVCSQTDLLMMLDYNTVLFHAMVSSRKYFFRDAKILNTNNKLLRYKFIWRKDTLRSLEIFSCYCCTVFWITSLLWVSVSKLFFTTIVHNPQQSSNFFKLFDTMLNTWC